MGRRLPQTVAEGFSPGIKDGMPYGLCLGIGFLESDFVVTLDTLLNADFLTQAFSKMDVDGASRQTTYYSDSVLMLFRITEELREHARIAADDRR
jgi:hypothetical protein